MLGEMLRNAGGRQRMEEAEELWHMKSEGPL